MSAEKQNNRIELALGALALLLAVATVVLSSGNRNLQATLSEGQSKVARMQTLANLNNSLIQMLAKAAADNNDKNIRQLLANNGITYNVNSAPVASSKDDQEEDDQ